MKIPFNKPFIIGKELEYIEATIKHGRSSGDGVYTKKCQDHLEKRYGFNKVLLTTSCTDALEMAALLCEINPGDEVIMPAFTFVSCANAFALRGAKVIFCDINAISLTISTKEIEEKINERTKAIVIVHYAGVACEMDRITRLAKQHNLFLIEDAAHAIEGTFKGKALGTFGDFATLSFHETKNITCGEGGALIINNTNYVERAEIIRDKGTNRAQFFRREIGKYEWVDLGSSFLPSDITAAFLFAQLEKTDTIQKKRVEVWENYYSQLSSLGKKGLIKLPTLPDHSKLNGSIFYMICKTESERNALIDHLEKEEIRAVFHYLPLQKSPFYLKTHNNISLPVTEDITKRIIRLPLYFSITSKEQQEVIDAILAFFNQAPV